MVHTITMTNRITATATKPSHTSMAELLYSSALTRRIHENYALPLMVLSIHVSEGVLVNEAQGEPGMAIRGWEPCTT